MSSTGYTHFYTGGLEKERQLADGEGEREGEGAKSDTYICLRENLVICNILILSLIRMTKVENELIVFEG
jgi:hypothetical protein